MATSSTPSGTTNKIPVIERMVKSKCLFFDLLGVEARSVQSLSR